MTFFYIFSRLVTLTKRVQLFLPCRAQRLHLFSYSDYALVVIIDLLNDDGNIRGENALHLVSSVLYLEMHLQNLSWWCLPSVQNAVFLHYSLIYNIPFSVLWSPHVRCSHGTCVMFEDSDFSHALSF
jgi:hypothetical protein